MTLTASQQKKLDQTIALLLERPDRRATARLMAATDGFKPLLDWLHHEMQRGDRGPEAMSEATQALAELVGALVGLFMINYVTPDSRVTARQLGDALGAVLSAGLVGAMEFRLQRQGQDT